MPSINPEGGKDRGGGAFRMDDVYLGSLELKEKTSDIDRTQRHISGLVGKT